MTNMTEFAPPKSNVPAVLFIQSIAIEYIEEYFIVEPTDSRIWYVVTSLGR